MLKGFVFLFCFLFCENAWSDSFLKMQKEDYEVDSSIDFLKKEDKNSFLDKENAYSLDENYYSGINKKLDSISSIIRQEDK